MSQKKETVLFVFYHRNGTLVMRVNCLYPLLAFISAEAIRSFFFCCCVKLNVLQRWNPFNSAFNLTWTHTCDHCLASGGLVEEGSHCKFFNLGSTIKRNLNRIRSEAKTLWDQKGKLSVWIMSLNRAAVQLKSLCMADMKIPF